MHGLDGRPAEVCEGGATLATYQTNALGERVVADPGPASHFHYAADGRLLAETDATGGLVAATVYLNGQPFAQLTPDGEGGLRLLYIETDHLGTPKRMLGASSGSGGGGEPGGGGAGMVVMHIGGVYYVVPFEGGSGGGGGGGSGTTEVVWDRQAEPFGGPHLLTADPDADNAIRFPGQREAALTGLHYNYFRDYDPALGRYLQPDPIGLAGGDVNLYSYVWSDPTNTLDPLGLQARRGPRVVPVTPGGRALTTEELNIGFRAESLLIAIRRYDPNYRPPPVLRSPESAPYARWDIARFEATLQNYTREAVPLLPQNQVCRGGAYTLRDASTGRVLYSGRSIDLLRRRGDHQRDPRFEGLRFEPAARTDSYWPAPKVCTTS